MAPQKHDETKKIMSGKIFSVPLNIDQAATKKTLFKTRISLHVSKAPDEATKSGNSKLGGIRSVVAICSEGTFYTILTDDTILSMRKNRQRHKFADDKWLELVKEMFSFDDELLRTENGMDNFQVIATLITSNEYDLDLKKLADNEEISESNLTVSIQTNDKIPVTIGSFTLDAIDEFQDSMNANPSHELREQEFDVFSWLDVLGDQNERLKQIVKKLTSNNNSLATERDFKTKEIQQIISEHDVIINDLQDKFYQVLNSKKAKIWELEGKDTNDLDYLNEKYVEEQKLNLNHISIDKDKIPDKLDSVYLSRNKKRKVSPTIKKEKNIEDEAHETENNVSTRLRRKRESDLEEPKVKKEQNSQLFASDHDLLQSVLERENGVDNEEDDEPMNDSTDEDSQGNDEDHTSDIDMKASDNENVHEGVDHERDLDETYEEKTKTHSNNTSEKNNVDVSKNFKGSQNVSNSKDNDTDYGSSSDEDNHHNRKGKQDESILESTLAKEKEGKPESHDDDGDTDYDSD